MIGKVYAIPPQPVDPENTRWFAAGVVTVGLEYREVDPAGLIDTYKDNPDHLAELIERSPEGGFSDQGVSLHVAATDDGHEYLRFDAFDDEPHYHYIHRGPDVVNNVIDYDTVAHGDMLTWALERIRTRLPEMLSEAGGGHLVSRLDPTALNRVIDQVERLARGHAARFSENGRARRATAGGGAMTPAPGPTLAVDPLTAAIGAEIRGVDLSEELHPDTVAALRQALLDHLVLFFRDQRMTTDDHIRFARSFGEIDLPLFRTTSSPRPEVIVLDQVAPKGQGADSWHADNTYMECPPMGSILRAVVLPPVGGDTCFASMYAAYDALSPALRAVLDGLGAVHSLEQMVERTKHVANARLRDSLDQWPPVVHPVVRVHPETGRKLLNVNANWTTSIDGFAAPESDALLGFLLGHLKNPEFQCRFHWSEGAVAFWDNRVVQHYAVADYTSRRVMERVTIAGDRPVGPGVPAG